MHNLSNGAVVRFFFFVLNPTIISFGSLESYVQDYFLTWCSNFQRKKTLLVSYFYVTYTQNIES